MLNDSVVERFLSEPLPWWREGGSTIPDPSGGTLVSEKVLAKILGVEVRTLQAWRYRGGGPAYVRISSRCVRYHLPTVQRWVADRIAASTSAKTQAEADREA